MLIWNGCSGKIVAGTHIYFLVFPVISWRWKSEMKRERRQHEYIYIYNGDVLLATNSTRSKLNYRNDNDNVLGCIVCVCVWVLGMWWFYLNMYVSWQTNVVRCPGNMLHQTNSLYSLLFIASGNRKMYCYFIVLVKWLFYYTFSGSKTINNAMA